MPKKHLRARRITQNRSPWMTWWASTIAPSYPFTLLHSKDPSYYRAPSRSFWRLTSHRSKWLASWELASSISSSFWGSKRQTKRRSTSWLRMLPPKTAIQVKKKKYRNRSSTRSQTHSTSNRTYSWPKVSKQGSTCASLSAFAACLPRTWLMFSLPKSSTHKR